LEDEVEIQRLVDEIKPLERKFSKGSWGYFLNTDDQATFKGVILEIISITREALGPINDYTSELIRIKTELDNGMMGGPSLNDFKQTLSVANAAMRQINRKNHRVVGGVRIPVASKQRKPVELYVDSSRIAELKQLKSDQFDFARLIQLCDELNSCIETRSYHAIAMLVRSILDHVPPIFGCKKFSEVANNYAGTSSFKLAMGHLHNALRKIADSHLHTNIRKSEALPNKTQVDFRQSLDQLLQEVVRLHKA